LDARQLALHLQRLLHDSWVQLAQLAWIGALADDKRVAIPDYQRTYVDAYFV